MKKILFFSLLMFIGTVVQGQSAYIEVKGESNLSVYLNGKFKAKTAADVGGCIIENVTPGINLIKIVKEGFTPFEETITIKPEEVFAYKVKPFTKHIVHVSEEGNTGETDKKAFIKTGKLIIQSVPIEIKIEISDIEGINGKTKDKWQAEDIPAGRHEITLTYNQKVITKTIEIIGNETTSLFVNMLSGEFKTNNSLNDKKDKERLEYIKYSKASNFIDSLCTKFKFKKGLTESEFINFNPEAVNIMRPSRRNRVDKNTTVYMYMRQQNKIGITNINFIDNIISRYQIMVIEDRKGEYQSQLYYSNLFNDIKKNISKEYFRSYVNDYKDYYSLDITVPGKNIKIGINYSISRKGDKDEYGHVVLDFQVVK